MAGLERTPTSGMPVSERTDNDTRQIETWVSGCQQRDIGPHLLVDQELARGQDR